MEEEDVFYFIAQCILKHVYKLVLSIQVKVTAQK